jgi:hypothetical protein
MAWTKSVKPTTTYTLDNKFSLGYLLLQDGGYCLLQTGGKIQLFSHLQNIFDKVAKVTSSWTIGGKP